MLTIAARQMANHRDEEADADQEDDQEANMEGWETPEHTMAILDGINEAEIDAVCWTDYLQVFACHTHNPLGSLTIKIGAVDSEKGEGPDCLRDDSRLEGCKCYLVEAKCQGTVEGMECSTEIRSYILPHCLATLQQTHTEYLKVDDRVTITKRTEIKRVEDPEVFPDDFEPIEEQDYFAVAQKSTNMLGQEDGNESLNYYAACQLRGFLSEGATMLFSRLKIRNRWDKALDFLTLNGSGGLCKLTLGDTETITVDVLDSMGILLTFEKRLGKARNQRWDFKFLPSGYLYSWEQSGLPIYMKCTQLPEIEANNCDDANSSPAVAETENSLATSMANLDTVLAALSLADSLQEESYSGQDTHSKSTDEFTAPETARSQGTPRLGRGSKASFTFSMQLPKSNISTVTPEPLKTNRILPQGLAKPPLNTNHVKNVYPAQQDSMLTLDSRKNSIPKTRSYLLDHPELKFIVADFIRDVLCQRPDDVPAFARLYFKEKAVRDCALCLEDAIPRTELNSDLAYMNVYREVVDTLNDYGTITRVIIPRSQYQTPFILGNVYAEYSCAKECMNAMFWLKNQKMYEKKLIVRRFDFDRPDYVYAF